MSDKRHSGSACVSRLASWLDGRCEAGKVQAVAVFNELVREFESMTSVA